MYQLIVVGGGLTGACLALALSQRSQGALSIALIEASALEPACPGSDDRAIALAYRSCQQLATLGLWPQVAAEATAIDSIQITEADRSGLATLRAADYQLPVLGQVVAMPTLRQQLARLLTVAAGVTVYAPAEVISITRQSQRVLVHLKQGRVLSGSLLVLATGTHSPLLKPLALRYQGWDHQQQALIATITTAEPHRGRAFERFTQTGSVAILPKTATECALIWCQASACQQQLLTVDEQPFLQQLQQQFGWRLGALLRVKTRQCYPLSTQIALRPVGHRWVAIGNAAQTLHPIAAQGFNLALRDVMQLADCLISAWQQQQDLGGYALLSDYQQIRQPDQQRMVTFTRGLLQLFGRQQPLLRAGRGVGLRLFDSCPLFKDQLTAWLLGTTAW